MGGPYRSFLVQSSPAGTSQLHHHLPAVLSMAFCFSAHRPQSPYIEPNVLNSNIQILPGSSSFGSYNAYLNNHIESGWVLNNFTSEDGTEMHQSLSDYPKPTMRLKRQTTAGLKLLLSEFVYTVWSYSQSVTHKIQFTIQIHMRLPVN